MVWTATGRVDVVMRTADRLYLFELKLNRSADEPMEQILVKDYPSRFSLTGLPVVTVGINFDTERHTRKDRKIEEKRVYSLNIAHCASDETQFLINNRQNYNRQINQ